MTFLELVQELHRESGSGGTAPSTLDSVRGENLRLKNWVKKADLFVQELYIDWQFLWAQHSVDVLEGTRDYSPLSGGGGFSLSPTSQIGEYDRKTFKLDGEPLDCVNYIDVKSDMDITTPGQASKVILMPDGSLRLDLIPDTDYTLTFDYWITPIALSTNDSEPTMPARFHDVILGKALTLYAKYENAEEIMQQGAELYQDWIEKLEADQLPGDRYMHRLAEGAEMVISVE